MREIVLQSTHRWAVGLLAAALLGGCAEEKTPEEQAAEVAREIALVEKANATLPPIQPVDPQPIAYSDIERHSLSGAGCNFAPGTSVATRVMARPADAHMKIDGEIVRFAADSGSPELPLGTRSRYVSGAHELHLKLEDAAEGEDYVGTIMLYDEHGRLVYEGSGLARCKG